MSISNKIEQRERRELAGSTTTTTYFRQSQIHQDLDAPGGRFREKETTVGADLVPQYPRLPSSSPWSGDPVGVEPPLGIDVNFQEPCGEAFEVERSLLAAPAIPGSPPAEDTTASSVESAKVAAPLSSSGGAATPSAEERLAQIPPKIAVPATKIRKRKA
jgi:hypothetical protein